MLLSVVTGLNTTVYADTPISGQCGENAIWNFDTDNKTLSISGTGIIRYDSLYDTPWKDFNEQIETIVISEGITDFGYCDFYYCDNCKNLYLPASLKSITSLQNKPIFYNKIENIYYKGSINSWVEIQFPFYSFEDWEFGTKSFGGLSFNNLYINENLVKNADINSETINNYCFYGCNSVESVNINKNVSEIGYHAFDNCPNLKKVSYNGTYDEAKALDIFQLFKKCDELYIDNKKFNELEFDKNLLNEGYFNSCKYIEKINLSEDITEIPNYAFSGYTNLTTINTPTSLVKIGDYAYEGCINLESISIPKSVKSIGYGAIPTLLYFKWCDEDYENIKLNIVKNFEGSESDWAKIAFGMYHDEGDSGYSDNGCNLYINNSPLTNARISNVERINAGAFDGCQSLVSLTTDLSLVEIGRQAFTNCNNLISITIPSNIKLHTYSNYQGALYQESFSSSNLQEINILSGSTEISEDFATLVKGSSISKMIIPSTITYIPDSAFKDMNSLLSVTIPKSVSRIEYNAFSGCTNLTIKGYKGSYAETYANLLGIPFEALDDTTGHTHNYTVKTTKATTSTDGSIITSCDVCGDVKSNKMIYHPASVTLSAVKYTYNGKAKKPAVTVKDSSGAVISSNNYTVTYTNNLNVGKATVKITFKGNYSGAISKTFTIIPKPTAITSLMGKSKGFTVKWNKITSQADGYQIQYAANSSFKSAKTITVKGNKNKAKIISKLRGNKKYYVRVRTYKKVKGKTYYSAWSKAKPVKTKK